jgi:threonine/homoserine/homoserine lactone efflux protein
VISSATAISFFWISLLLGFTPGPDNLYVLVQSAKLGKRAGIWILLGLCTGLMVQTFAVALGLATLFVKSAYAFTVLKYFGAAYLIYLAWKIAFAQISNFESVQTAYQNRLEKFIKGLILNLSNPKVLLFFLAFLPQFVNENSTSVGLELLTLGFIFIIATLIAFCAIILLANQLRILLIRNSKLEVMLNRVTSLIFIGLAFHLIAFQFK